MASSSTSASTCVYDIFINHRGPDCKKTLATYLYDRLSKQYGLRVFLDQRELQEGDPYPSQIEGAIRTASVHIAIFSPRYAESIWCLKELVLILESNKTIIPVFYGVQPSELRWTQRGDGVYARSLRDLQEKTIDSQTGHQKPRYDSNIIAKWREALSRVAEIHGFVMETSNGDEQQLVEKVVEGVLKQTRVMGIVGLGGVGKTTLAKELFNRQELSGNNNMVDRKYKSGDKNVIGPNTQIDGNPILGDNSGNANNSGNKINRDNNNTLNSNNTVNSNTVFCYRQELIGNNNMVDGKYKSGDKNVIGPNNQIDGNPILGDNSGNKIREVELKIEVSICEAEQSEVMGKDEDWIFVKDLMNYCEDSRQQEVYLAEEEIIDDSLSFWASSDQREDVKPCIFVTNDFDVSIGFAEDEKSFEAVKIMEEYFSEDKYSKADEECLLNEESSDAFIFEVVTYEECLLNEEISDAFIFEVVTDEECLLNEESSDAFIFEVVTTQEEFLVEEGEEIHSEALEDISDKLKQRDGDSSKSQTMYQFKELLNKRDKEIMISDNQEKVISCRKQEGKDDRVAVTIKVQQSKSKSNQQSENLLDRETKLIRSRL